MTARRRDEWDDWDGEAEAGKPAPGLLSTPRILIGLAAVVAIALVFGTLVRREPMQFSEVPAELIGTWTSDDPAASDLWVEFRRDSIIFGTGGTGKLKCRVVGIDTEEVGGLDRFVVRYRDMGGKNHFKEIRLNAAKNELWFTDQPGRRWSRYD
jgi:hypothetical protein